MVELPHSTGKSKKVEIASEETFEKLKTGKIDFDVLIATAQDMPKLVPFAKLLGPRGMMPNPKNGTLVDDPKKAVSNFGGNNIQLKTEKSAPLIHTVVGKTTMDEKEIAENVNSVLNTIGKKVVKKAVISATMGPGIQVQIS
jgi:large subunit ribosomal protein L1